MSDDGLVTTSTQSLAAWLETQIAEDEAVARNLSRDLDAQIEDEGLTGQSDERGPFTPVRMLSAQLWSHYDGQTRWRNFARGQLIASLADPARVLAECEAKRAIIADHAPTDTAWSRRIYSDADDDEGTEIYDEPACRQCTDSVQFWRVTSNWDVADRIVAPCDTLRALALPFQDRDGWRSEWA